MVSLPLKFGEFAVEIVTGNIPEVGIVSETDLVVDVSIAVPFTAVISPALFSLNWRVTPKFSAGAGVARNSKSEGTTLSNRFWCIIQRNNWK